MNKIQEIKKILTVDEYFRECLRYEIRLNDVDLSDAIDATIKLYEKKGKTFVDLYSFLASKAYNDEISEEVKKSLQKNEPLERVCPECLGEGSYRNKNEATGGYSNTACPECFGDGYIELVKTEDVFWRL